MIFAGVALAQRLEWAEASNDSECTAAGGETAVERIGGGCAVFAGAASPLTRAVGLGLAGPVGDAEADALERFFHRRGAKVSVDLCPLADPGLLDALCRRGYRSTEFNNVLVKDLIGMEPYPRDPRVRPVADDESELWARTVGAGFFETVALTEDELEIGRAVFRVCRASCYLGRTDDTGAAAAGAALSVRSGLALLFADSTVAPFRRTGLHGALIRARLNCAIAQGCDMASASTAPGSASQRNYERLGFRVAYTKVLLVEG